MAYWAGFLGVHATFKSIGDIIRIVIFMDMTYVDSMDTPYWELDKRAKSTETSKGTSKSQLKSIVKSTQAEETVFEAGDTQEPHNQGQDTALTDLLDWNNPKGKEYPFYLSKPLPLILVQGRQVVPIDYFINNDLEYLRGGSLSMKYMTSTTKTKVAKYDILGIVDMVPSLWSPVKYDVYSTKKIIAVTKVKVMNSYDYGYLEVIKFRREDQQLYKFKECDFPRLHLHDIEDMMLLLVQKKLSNLERDVIFNLGVALRMFTRRIVILKRVEDLQLGVKSYQKKLNITKLEIYRSDISKRTPYTAYNNPQGIIYVDKYKRNRLMRSDELYKFSDGTLTSV
ncbi:hypothetical protein Tco_0196633 [Tanacetum coccineum]